MSTSGNRFNELRQDIVKVPALDVKNSRIGFARWECQFYTRAFDHALASSPYQDGLAVAILLVDKLDRVR